MTAWDAMPDPTLHCVSVAVHVVYDLMNHFPRKIKVKTFEPIHPLPHSTSLP